MEQQVLAILSTIQPHLYWMLLKFVIAAIIILLLKNFISSVAAYTQFRMNKYLGIGVKIHIQGQIGTIANYSLRWIFIKFDDGKTLIIPMKKWQNYDWILCYEIE